jgi:hypothetical protein
MAIFLMWAFSLMTLMISCRRPSDSGLMVALSKSNWIFSSKAMRLFSTTTRLGGSGSGSGSGGGGGGGGGRRGGSPTIWRAVASSNTVGPQAARAPPRPPSPNTAR